MAEQAFQNKVSSKVVFKSGLWYTISTFLFRSIAFITTPIIVRVLTRSQYGDFNNMQSWVSLLSIFASCCLEQTIIRAKLDYEDETDSYSYSILVSQAVLTTVVFLIVGLFLDPICAYTKIDPGYFFIIYLYVLFSNVYGVFVTRERAHYRYKAYSLTTGLMIVAYCLLTVFLVLKMTNKLDAIIFGNYIPYIVAGAVFFGIIAKDGKHVSWEHVKYALPLGLPLLPHTLSIILLGSSDTIMITKMLSADFTALYALSSKIPNIVSVLLNSMNGAWAPWFLDSMKANDKTGIKRISSIYYKIFLILITGIMLLAPEVMLVLGGEKYLPGLKLVPPLIAGCVFQFAYTMYVQVEFYEKKMRTVSTATAIAAATNIALNFMFMRLFGYQVAAYTTLVSYGVLFGLHYRAACRLGYSNVFDRRVIFGGLGLTLAMIPVLLFLYQLRLIRWIVILVYGIFLLYYLYKRKDLILKFYKKGK